MRVLYFWVLCLIRLVSAQSNFSFDDTDGSIQYSISPAWDTRIWADQVPQPLGGTNHGTPNPGAGMTFAFTGTAVYVYGFKAQDHGFRDVTVDSRPVLRCDGRTGQQGSRSLVFGTSGLENRPHTLVIRHSGSQGQYLNIDYILVEQSPNDLSGTSISIQTVYVTGTPTTLSSSTSTSTSSLDSSSSSNTQKSPFPVAAVAGGAAGGIAIFCLLFVLCLYIRNRRRRESTQKQVKAIVATMKEVNNDTRPYSSADHAIASGIVDRPDPRSAASLNKIPPDAQTSHYHTGHHDPSQPQWAPPAPNFQPTGYPHRNIHDVAGSEYDPYGGYMGGYMGGSHEPEVVHNSFSRQPHGTVPPRPMSDFSQTMSSESRPMSVVSSYQAPTSGGSVQLSYNANAAEQEYYTHHGKGDIRPSVTHGTASSSSRPPLAAFESEAARPDVFSPPPQYTPSGN